MSGNDAEDALNKLLRNPGVLGYAVANPDGVNLKSQFSGDMDGQKISGLMVDMLAMARKTMRAVKMPDDLPPNQMANYRNESMDICSIRLRTKNIEFVVVPEDMCTLIVVQTPSDLSQRKAGNIGLPPPVPSKT